MSGRRPWWRSRRLVVAIVCLDLLGAGLLVYALTRPSNHRHASTSASARAAVVHPAAASVRTTTQGTSTTRSTTSEHHPKHRHPRMAAATVMPKASMSRAPAIPGNAKGHSADTPLAANVRASFARLRASLAGEAHIAVAVQPLGRGPMQIFGGSPGMPAMSTSKVFILSALLRDRGGVANFTAEQQSLAETAITESDNDSILALFSDLEADKGGLDGASAYATELLHQAGDDRTQVTTGPVPPGYATTFGQTPWTPAGEVTFFRALANGCLLPSADVNYILGLMRQIEPSESWGLGSAGFDQVAFKGGWGPLANGYGVRQTGIIGTGNNAVVVSIAADPATSFATGQTVLDQIARWLRSEIRPDAHPPALCAR